MAGGGAETTRAEHHETGDRRSTRRVRGPRAVRGVGGGTARDPAGANLHVAHLTNSLRWDGTGHTNSTVDLAMEQAALGHHVTMMCGNTDARMLDLMTSHGLRVVDGLGGASPGELIRSARRCAHLIDSFDVVHVHTVRASLLALLASPRAYLRRSVATLHNPHQRSAAFMYTAARVVTLNRDDQRRVRNVTLGLRRPAVINNGLIGGRRLSTVDQVTPLPLRSPAIVFTGALHRRKGLDVLLGAMRVVTKAVPTAHLYVVGNRDNPAMEQLATALGVAAATTFTGFSNDPREYMKAATVFVLPSRVEGFGNVLIEARSCGTAIVASGVGGIPEALSGGRAGFLVPPADEKALADSLIRVLTDDALVTELRNASSQNLDDFTVAGAARAYTRVYASLALKP